VRHAVVFVYDVNHIHTAEHAAVVRLAAGGWIESGTVELDAAAAVRAFDNRRVKRAEIGVGVVETFGH
jgi:hypothetical protein